MENEQAILQGSSDMEKGAYLGAIASIASADRQATDEEVGYLTQLAQAAGLSQDQTEAVVKAAREITDEDAKRCLDILKGSELRFSLVTDLIAFAKADHDYSENEKQTIEKMSTYLGINQEQFSLLDHFTDKSKQALLSAGEPSAQPEEIVEEPKEDLLTSLGLKDKMESAGIKGSSLLKGLLGIAAPMILANMVTGGLNRNRGMGGGLFSGGGGGMFGGGGGLLGGGGGMLGGSGLGAIFSMLGGGRSYRNSGGGLLGRIFGGGF